jgi:hypothetical protein
MNRSNTNSNQRDANSQQLIMIGLAAATAVASMVIYYYTYNKQYATNHSMEEEEYDELGKPIVKKTNRSTPTVTTNKSTSDDSKNKEEVNKAKTDEKALHAMIEELDKKGKLLFKNSKVRKEVAVVARCVSLSTIVMFEKITSRLFVVLSI